ncbi:MAG: PilZ domain-containing protein [Myxococcales bacterium]|nr:PilZ domain-containing protein [Myxococcales bacterium]
MSHLHRIKSIIERRDPRVPLDILCSEYVQERQTVGILLDVSMNGLRIQRLPRRLLQPDRRIQLEFELPGSDETIWALAEMRFDQVGPARGSPILVRTSGLSILRAAAKHLRLLADYVRERAVGSAAFAPG